MNAIDLSAYDTDKSAAYLANYDREVGHLYDKPIALLELGVQRGGSLLLWRDRFPHGKIAGLDLNPVEVRDDSGRIRVYTGFQQDPAVLDRITAEVAPDGFDVIIDDASHLGVYTAASFWHSFPRHLRPGGIYVLEDWSVGYRSDWPDGHRYTGTRAALGEQASQPSSGGDHLDGLRRRVRGAARPVAARISELSPELRDRLEKLYMKLEGASIRSRFPSHDYGMVGFVKQLVDAAAIDVIDGPRRTGESSISAVHVTTSQVFVHKAP